MIVTPLKRKTIYAGVSIFSGSVLITGITLLSLHFNNNSFKLITTTSKLITIPTTTATTNNNITESFCAYTKNFFPINKFRLVTPILININNDSINLIPNGTYDITGIRWYAKENSTLTLVYKNMSSLFTLNFAQGFGMAYTKAYLPTTLLNVTYLRYTHKNKLQLIISKIH